MDRWSSITQASKPSTIWRMPGEDFDTLEWMRDPVIQGTASTLFNDPGLDRTWKQIKEMFEDRENVPTSIQPQEGQKPAT